MKAMQLNDKELLRSAQKYETGTLASIYEHLSPGIFRYAYRLLSSKQNAEDCVTDTFIGFLSALEAGKGPRDNLKAYLFRSAHNWIIDHYRNHSRFEIEISEEFIDDNNSVEEQTENRLRMKETIIALEHLTSDQKEVVLLRYGEDLNIKQIARVVNKSQGAVKALLHRAIYALQREFHNDKK